MARPTTAKSKKVRVLLGDGATPEVFTAACALREKSFNRSKETNSTAIPDCDPDAPAGYTESDVVSQSATISGSGVMTLGDFDRWEAAWNSSESVSVRHVTTYGDGTVVTREGKFHLTSFEEGASDGEVVQVSFTMENDGPVTTTKV